MSKKYNAIIKQARRLKGQPVCVVLNNGSFYVGCISGIEKGELILSGKKGRGKLSRSNSPRTKKAQISSFLPGLGSLFGMAKALAPSMMAPNGAVAAPAAPTAPQGGGGGFLSGFGGLGGVFGFVQKAWPAVRMGMGMVKTIIPLFGGFGK